MEDIDQQARWEPGPILAQEGPPLAPLSEAPIEIEEISAMPVQGDGTVVEDDAAAE